MGHGSAQRPGGSSGRAGDLRDYPMPFFEQTVAPTYGHRDYPEDVARWAGKVEEADGYIIVTAEYNHGYPAI
ncbi:MAG TPA: NAD(P)H-dependent oxidoreductase [Solirubrobacteraceae bacterium]